MRVSNKARILVLGSNYLIKMYIRENMLPLLTPVYLMFFVNIVPNSGQQRENGTNQTIPQI